jgi:hypothetical protein
MAVRHPAAKRSERSYLSDPAVRWLVDADLAIQQAMSGKRLETELQVLQILVSHTVLEMAEVQQLMIRVKGGSLDAYCRAVELLSDALRRRHEASVS